jgi:hypothetical protein
MWMPAQNSRSVPGLLYLTAVRDGSRELGTRIFVSHGGLEDAEPAN